jgi:hypothetical protein
MKRLQIMIEDDLDDAVHAVAIAEHTSKAAVIRRLVRQALPPLPPPDDDPLMRMVGIDDFEPVEHIDAYLYG